METVLKTIRERKGNSIIAFPDEFCIVDLETTGLSPEYDNIIEVASIYVKNGVIVDTFQSLVKPPLYGGVYVDDFITELTGITNEMLDDAPTITDILPQFLDFLGSRTIIGYNVHFDANFLYDNALSHLDRYFTNELIDVYRMTRKLYPDLPHHRLCDMLSHFEISELQEHRALGDCYATLACYDHCKNAIASQYSCNDEFIKSFEKKRLRVYAADIASSVAEPPQDSMIYGKKCVFTGKLERYTRRDAMQIVADLGGINEDTVTKHTNYLILGTQDYRVPSPDKKSSKHRKAEKYKLSGCDVEIMPESVFYDMIADYISDSEDQPQIPPPEISQPEQETVSFDLPLIPEWEKWKDVITTQCAKKRMARAAACKLIVVSPQDHTAVFKGSKGNTYTTTLESCTCPDFDEYNEPCKHMYRLLFELS